MDSATTDTPLLSQEHVAFLGMGVSVNVATRDANFIPLVNRACGCRASVDRRQVTVFLSTLYAGALLEAVAQSGSIAVVISQPSTHRTLQLKGGDARVVAVEADDQPHFQTFREAFAADLASVGYPVEFAQAVVPEAGVGLVAVRFTPSAAFDQTPGRNAGQPLSRA